jgi:hypothetical protein
VLEESTISHHDAAPLHLLTTASLGWLQRRLPASRIDGRRFRPNILLGVAGDQPVEDRWVGRRFTASATLPPAPPPATDGVHPRKGSVARKLLQAAKESDGMDSGGIRVGNRDDE